MMLGNGALKLPLAKLSLRGTPKWRAHQMLHIDLPSIISKAVHTPMAHSLDILLDMAKSFHLGCPRSHCTYSRSVASRKLHSRGKWMTLHCPSCDRASTAKYWRCACDVAWTMCPLHSLVGFHCGKPNTGKCPTDNRISQEPMRNPTFCHRVSIRDAHRLIVQRQSGKPDDALCVKPTPCKRPARDATANSDSVAKPRLAVPQGLKRSCSAANLPARGPAQVSQPSSSSNRPQSQRPPDPPNRRRLRGQYRSDPDMRAAQSKRMRTDPIAVINRLRNDTPVQPHITPPVKAPDD
jgi:hypothetical protein